MTIEQFKNTLPDFAKDIKLNLSTVLKETTNGLDLKQMLSIALSSAYSTQQKETIAAIQDEAFNYLSEPEINAAKAAATIMAMNNVYYRFTHSISDQAYATLPAKLRMNVIGNPGIDKVLFELNSLAVSAINGCSKCMDAHAFQLEKAGISKTGIQSTIRIAAVVHAAAVGSEIGLLS